MSLPMKKIEYFEVFYKDFEKFVAQHYPEFKKYRFPLIEECGNDVTRVFNVTDDLNEDDKEEFEEMLSNKEVSLYRNDLLFTKLCSDNLIPAGKYLVNVSW